MGLVDQVLRTASLRRLDGTPEKRPGLFLVSDPGFSVWRSVLARSPVHPGPWTFSTIGSTNGVVVDEIDDWEYIFGPRMDVSDEWEIKMDERNDWETENVSQSFETSTRPP